ncbi:hypothetical protein BDW02DRAFT_563822 [Decorospora gaudefroyi]|uniref:Uncharacterized protein n=1 Tax=Decorospora gaudefroyi TaxID=184978 RepID=A0A6A5KWK9_9PLEO|nr:hypothetical protein BDW02DRAFT_563822 [Decorospora gaudefroyi]
MVKTRLPPNIAITKRSRKFYDGTYTWDSEGFTDDHGVYRGFDCYEPLARAPTPLPPMFLGEESEERDIGGRPSSYSPNAFAFTSDTVQGGFVTVPCNELIRGYDSAGRERLVGKMEDVLGASRVNKVDLTLEESYQLCGIPDSAGKAGKVEKRNITPSTSSPTRKGAAPANPSEPITSSKTAQSKHWSSPSNSELSDCPSDISQWDVSNLDPKSSADVQPATSKQHKEEEEVADKPKMKPKTRGIAQKVKKGVKKPTRADLGDAALSLVGVQMDFSTVDRRRSARHANAQGRK